MKAAILASAAIFGGALAELHHIHGHNILHLKKRNNEAEVCLPECTTIYTTITGDFIWQPTPGAPPASPETTLTKTSTSTATITSTTEITVAPTPVAHTVDTPGTYTFPESTLTLTNTTTVISPSTTEVPPGVHTLGGVTTVVETATTIVCPYATTSTLSAGVVTSIIESTTYVCPTPGTYTIKPTVTTVTATSEIVTVLTVTSYLPGVYTAPPVTTVVTTATVVYCPYTSVGAPTTSSTPVVTPTVIPSVPEVSSIASSIVSSATEETTSVPSTGNGGILGTDGSNPWAITYTPYDHDTGNCQTAEKVDAELQSIAASGIHTIRVYSTDCDALPNVGNAAAKHGIKMIVGIYIGSVGCNNGSPDVEEQINAYKEWARWDLVELFAVGNEALNNGYCTAQELANLISHVKSELPGYTGPYTTTDVVSAWEKSDTQSLICGVVDFPSANIHSYFDPNTSPAEAGSFVKSQLDIVSKACGGKEAYVLECGFPTAGQTIGNNVPSVANQEIALKNIKETLGEKVVFFSMFDDSWKSPGSCDCEKHWGMGSLFGAA